MANTLKDYYKAPPISLPKGFNVPGLTVPQAMIPGDLGGASVNKGVVTGTGIRHYSFPNSQTGYDTAGNTTQPNNIPPTQPNPVPPIFTGGTKPTVPTGGGTPAPDLYAKYRDANGKILTPDEYANSMAVKARGTNTSVGGYAGSQVTDPNQSTEDLTAQERTLNNAANDIATGTTDPYGVASDSGIQYTPAQLNAIEKAYAGIYDPAINDVFAKLDAKQKKDAEEQARQDKITEEANWYKRQDYANAQDIAKYNATTGANDRATTAQPYTIKTGDDLRKIASANGLTYEALKAENPAVDETNLRPGQSITLPKGGAVKAKALTQGEMDVQNEAAYVSWLAGYKLEHDNKAPDDILRAQIMRSLGLKPSDYGIDDIS